jgi:hypothetical protein
MLPFSTWREVLRIPWIRENRKAVRFLSDLFYLLIALHRAGRIQDFNYLKHVYFEMIESFAQYGRNEAKDTVDRVLRIAWFAEHRRDLYRLISAYKRVIDGMQVQSQLTGNSPDRQKRVNGDIEDFVQAFKALIDFDAADDARANDLSGRPEVMDASMAHIKAATESYGQQLF